jgi:hypothetical protein
MSKKLLLPANEITAVLKCIDNVVDRRIEISKKDAADRKPDVNHKRNAEFLEGARASLKSKMTKVLAPSAPTDPSASSSSSSSLLDTEAIDRLSSLNAAYDAQAAKVAALREEAALKSLEVTAMELAACEAAALEAASASASTATMTSDPSSRTADLLVGMDASLRKMGSTLGSLVADMPDALDGLGKTLDAVEALAQGKDLSKGEYLSNHPVDVAIRTSIKAGDASSSSSSTSSSSSSAAFAATVLAPLSAVKTPSSAAKRRKGDTPSKAEEEQQGEWDEDAFANLVGR